MKKVVGMGDFLLRLNPEGYMRFLQADRMMTYYTGAEANVCVSLAMLGMPASFVTRVPDHDVARAGLAHLRKYGVDVSHVAVGGPRLGVFYVEKGASQRPSKVIYDRADTSFSLSHPSDYDWDAIFEGAGWLHITGITPALGPDMPALCRHALAEAHRRGLTVSCDLNYRARLWTSEEAGRVMSELLRDVDVLIANEEDCARVLNIHAPDTDIEAGKLSRAGYEAVARQVCARYPVRAVAITLRGSLSASDNDWSAMLFDGKDAYFAPTYRMHIVDRVGGGDAFAAGLIYALSHDFSAQDAVSFATAASCLKHSMEMDFNLATLDEVLALMRGGGSGRVQR